MKNYLNLTKGLYRQGAKITEDKIGMTLCMRHSMIMGDCSLYSGVTCRVQFQSHEPYIVTISEQ